MAYSKLHSSIVNSSLWVEPDSTRLLFITLLAMCDRDGMVYGSRYGIARVANINPDEIDEAWAALLAPDPDSGDKIRAPENEGRRIEEVSGGFRLLNFEYYRGLRNEDDRRDQNRAAQARHKAKVSQGKPASATESHDKPQKAHTETDTETETKTHAPRTASRSVCLSDLVAEGVKEQYAADWLKARGKVPLTPTAWNAVKREAAKAGISASEAVKMAAEYSWRGFKADWVKTSNKSDIGRGAI